MKSKCFVSDYAYFYDSIYQDKDYKKEVDFLEKIFKKFLKKKPKNILDLGCGTGNHILELSKRGYKTSGVDISPDMIKIAQEKFKKLNLRGDFYIKDIACYRPRKKFDVIISMFAVINYIIEIKALLRLFKNVYSVLKKDGLFIFEIWNAFKAQNSLLPTSFKEIELDNKNKLIREGRIKTYRLSQICRIDYVLKLYNEEKIIKHYKENHILRFYYPQEIRNYLSFSNLKLINIYPSFRFGKIKDEDFHILYVAKK